MSKTPVWKHEIWMSLKIGAGIVLILIAAQLTAAHLPDSWLTSLIRTAAYPGFAGAARLLGVTDVASYSTPYGELSLLGMALDIAIYSGLVLLLRQVIGSWFTGDATRGGLPLVTGEGNVTARAVLRAAKIGYAIALILLLLTPIVSGGASGRFLGWLIAGGERAYRAFFGDPSHGVGGDLWFIGTTAINGAIYSAVMFLGEMAWGHLQRARTGSTIDRHTI